MIIKKILISIIVCIVLINVVFTPKTFAIADILKTGRDFLTKSDRTQSPIDEGKLSDVSSDVYNILLAIAIAVAVIVGAVLGITFILSSVEGKAKIMEALVPYIVGCFIVFGAFGIWKLAVNIGNGI